MPRRTRKRKAVIREPNGRASRRKEDIQVHQEMSEREAKSVGLSARMRKTGLPEHLVDGKPETGKPNVGTQQGYLCLMGYIDADQWTAAEWYLHRRNEYLQAVKAPGAQWQRHDEPVSSDPDAYARWCENAKAAWASIRACLQRVSIEARSPVMAAFDHILDRQTERLPHMHGDLRIGLNAISREFLVGRRAAA
ncbi:hypothetical protein ACN6KF_003034 [Labrys sp. La1]|uniref:hypothetical protein n=1 Tax=Labrys sp. La1 TaxID=3404917 RepID=UPI003EB7253F